MNSTKKIFIIILIVTLPVLFYKQLAGIYYDFLITNDPLKRTDAIFILGGGTTNRTLPAIKLYEKGYAKEIIFSRLRFTNNELREKKDFRKILLEDHNITNYKCLHTYKDYATSTFDEAYEAILYAKKNNLKSMTLVTSLTHTRRAKYAFNKVAKYLNYDMEIRVYGVKATQFFNYNRDNWWKNPYLFSHFMVVGMKFIIYILANNNVSFIKQI